MSLAEIKQELERIKDLVNQVEKLLESSKSVVEASAAKVIKDITAEMQKCPCNKEILDALKSTKPESSAIVKSDEPQTSQPQTSRQWKYNFPNYNVGNPELGSSGREKPFTWPPQ